MTQASSGESTPAQTPAGRPVAALSRELADFLVEFSIVLHKRAMYPVGHPHLQQSAERFVNRIESLLDLREIVNIGVARHQLIIGGVATDPRNALLSDLARRLHRHRVASARFERGVSLSEIDELLGALSADPQGDDGPLGLRPQAFAGWSHLQIQAPELSRLFLQDDEGEAQDEGRCAEDELWLGLANLALSSDEESATGREDPLVVARAIESQIGQVAYDRVVLDYLGQMAEEMSGRPGAWEPRVRQRVSRLVSSLKPDTLRRVLEAGADHGERLRFALTSAEVLAVDAVVEVVEAAAVTTGQTISNHLLRLLHKFAHHAEHGSQDTRVEAESTLRKNVARLIANWELEDPNPSEYTAVLDGMVRHSPSEARGEADPVGCDPETVLQIGLEIGCVGPRVYAALDGMLAERQISRVAELLHSAPDPLLADPLWRYVATPARLCAELAASPIDLKAVEGLAARLGPAAVEPLLDLLESTPERSARARALRVLGQIGAVAAAPAAARLGKGAWYSQRNILVLLRQLKIWPPGFSAVPYARHADPRVRREAYKFLLEFPLHRVSALIHGLEDPNDDIVAVVLRGALDSCPREAERALERFIGDTGRSPELRALGVRVLGRASGPQALPRLLELAGSRRSLLGWRLEPKTPVVLAAVAALARHWGAHPQAASLLAHARSHSDPEIRLAAQVRYA
jgi:hypothetical protein